MVFSTKEFSECVTISNELFSVEFTASDSSVVTFVEAKVSNKYKSFKGEPIFWKKWQLLL